MATKSILKSVDIKDKKLVRGFVSALENAKGKSAKTVIPDRKCKTLSKDEIKKAFGNG